MNFFVELNITHAIKYSLLSVDFLRYLAESDCSRLDHYCSIVIPVLFYYDNHQLYNACLAECVFPGTTSLHVMVLHRQISKNSALIVFADLYAVRLYNWNSYEIKLSTSCSNDTKLGSSIPILIFFKIKNYKHRLELKIWSTWKTDFRVF